MNSIKTSLVNKTPGRRAWNRALFLALLAFVLAIVLMPSVMGRAAAEDEYVSFTKVRFEFDDNDNALRLRPWSSNGQGVYFYYYAKGSTSESSRGMYWFYPSNDYTYNFSLTDVRLSRFEFNYTTSNNWEYYDLDHWRVEDGTLIITFKLIDYISDLQMTLNWSDNSNAGGIRPAIADFSPTLWLTTSSSSAGNTKAAFESVNIADNGDDTWTLAFSGVNIQPSKSSNRYIWLTWLDSSKATGEQNYFNQYKSSSNVGYMYIDLTKNDYSVTTLAHNDPTLHATLMWDDAGNLLGKRPTMDEFQPSLRLSTSNSSATDSNSRLVTIGENGYTITDNGDNTWSIDFTDVNVKEIYSENTNYRYLWLTWEGSDYYVNQNLNSYYFGASYSDIVNVNNIRWTVRSSILRVKLSWQDGGDQYSLRPTTDEFKSSVKLLLSNTTSNANSAEDVTGTDISVTDNGNNTWDVVFMDTTVRKMQNSASGNNKRYLFLTWSKDGKYANESVDFAQNGASYLDIHGNSNYNTGSSVLTYNQVPNYLVVTLNWRDHSDEFGTRPDADSFVPKLYISTSTSELTAENSKDVTGSDYTITENGNTWTIIFKDTTARQEQVGSYRYLWLSWDGDGKYLNKYKQYYYSGGFVPYLDLRSYSSPNLSFTALPSFVVATLNWLDQGNAAGLRPNPTPEAFVPTLHFSTSSTSVTGTTEITTGDYEIRDNGNNTWSIIFWNTDLPYKIPNSWRYIWLTWRDAEKETQFYANQATTNNDYGYTTSSVHSSYNYGGDNKLTFNAKPKLFQFRLNWESNDGYNSDNDNFANTRPLSENFKPHLWGSTSSSTAASAVDLTGSNWDIKEYDDYWVITLLDADEAVFRGTYSYFWLTWEDTSLGTDEASQYYFNQAKTTSQHGYTYQSASNTSINFTAWPKVFNIKLSWKDFSNAAGLRPDPDDVTWHLWYDESNNSSTAGATDLAGTDWSVKDNGDDTWTITFKNSDLLRKHYDRNNVKDISRYLFITWEGSDDYINDVKTNAYGCIRFYTRFYYAYKDGRFNGHSSYWRQQNDSVDGIYPKTVVATLNWHDHSDEFGNRPSIEEFVPHLWWTNSTSDSTTSTAREVTGNYEITENGDDTWTILFKDTDARKLTGSNTRYLWLTWDGSDQYYNTARKTTEYGYTYDSLNRTKAEVSFIARQKAFQILLNWEDGDNKLGYRPSVDAFTPHVWRSNTNGGNKVEITGVNWTVKDNGDNTWTLSFPEPENLSGVTADQYYIWLTWEGSDQYYNNVKDTSFGYMRELFTNDEPYYVLTTRAKHRELPLTLIWDDYANGRDTRPDPTQFTPHLWYQASNYAGGNQNVWVEIEAERDVDYIINADQDSQNKWVIRYLSIPYTYNREDQSGTTQVNISNYVLTWEGSSEYYNDIMTSGTYGYMSVPASSYAPSVTTRLKERSLDLTLRWSDYSNAGGYRPSIEEFTPQLYFGTNVRTNVPIELEDGSWTITDNGDDTWLIHFDSVPYAVATNSGSTNTYTNYWLTWTGSDEYWNQRQRTNSNSNIIGCMYFSREAANPSVTTYLKTRSRLIRLYWQDSQDANGWRPTPEELLANMHLWTSSTSVASVEIPMEDVQVVFEDTTSNQNYWDITIKHLPYYYDNGSYITNYAYYWLTWDGEHYINQVKNDVTPGAMIFSATASDRTTVYCYPDETEDFLLLLYWDDSSNANGWRPTPEEFTNLQLYYSTSDSGDAVGQIPESDYEWEIVSTSYSNSRNYWQIRIKGLPRSTRDANGNEVAIKTYWVNWEGKTDNYISKLRSYYYNGYLTSRFSNSPTATSASTSIYTKYARTATITINWDDNSNADGLRPTKDQFVPHLGYSGYGSAHGQSSRMIGTFENVPYTIDDSQDASNKWVVTFTDIPMVYPEDSDTERKVYYYWFTCDDVEGYNQLNPYNTNYYSISNSITSTGSTSGYNWSATLKREATKDISVTLNWSDSTNEWGRRPSLSSFVPHLWAGNDAETKYEIPLTADQWEVVEATPTSWKLNLKNVESLPAGYYWLTWDGSDDYYNQFKNNSRSGFLRWNYNTASPSVTIYPRKLGIVLYWQDGSNADGKRPDPNDWTPTLYYGTASGTIEQIPLNPSDWYLRSASGNQWTVEFYRAPDQYTNASGDLVNIPYYWVTFDTVGDYYYSDRTEAGYGELKWQWAVNANYGLNVYTKDRPLTINLTFSDNNGQVGERPEPTPESFGAHLWYGSSDEILGELKGLDYTITDNGDNTWTIVFDSVPGYYENDNGKDTAISYYWLTYEGGKYFLNDIRNTFSGTHGAMRAYMNSTNVYSMTTYCDYYRIGVKVNWTGATNIANVTGQEIDRSHTQYDLVDTVRGEVVETWEPDDHNPYSYSHVFYLPKYTEEGEAVDHHRYTVVQRGKPAVFTETDATSDYTSGVPGHAVTITNTAVDKLYRFNFTFDDDRNALKLRPATLQYLANEQGGNTYTYRGSISGISSTSATYSSPIISLLGRDLMEAKELDYALEFTNLGKYYDIQYVERLDDDGIINLDYTFTLKTQPVTLQVEWEDNDNEDNRRPVSVTEYLLANGVNMLSDNRLEFFPADAREDNPNIWEKTMILPAVDADGNPITWSFKQAPQEALRYYHAEQESTQEPDFGGQTVTLTNILQDNWNYSIELYWVSYGKGSLPDTDTIDVRNRYDIYETVMPNDDMRKYKYEMNISVNSAHYAVGDLEVRLPYYMQAVGANGTTRWVAPLAPTNDISVPQAPDYNPRYSYNYYIDDHGTKEDKSDDEIVFTNWEELSASSNTKIQVIYSLYPHEHLDTHIYELQAHGTGYATLNYDDETHSGDREDVAEEQDSNTITFGLDNGLDITAFSKRQSEPQLLHYYNTNYINSNHLSRAAFDTENFDYVAYNVYFQVQANQHATFSVTDLPGQNGEIVSVKYQTGGGSGLNTTSPTFSADKRIWTFTADPQGSGSTKYTYQYYWVVVAYPKSEGNIIMEDGRIFTRYTNEADIVAEALHPQNPDGKSPPPPDHNDEDAMNDATFIEWGDYRWKPSGKIFYYDKALQRNFNSGDTSKKPGGQTVLEYGGDIDASFHMVFYVNGDELAMDGVHEYYRFNITDNELWLHGTVNGGKTEYVKLEPGDYEIISISASATAKRTDHTTGEPLSNIPLGQFVLQGQTNETGQPGGEWVNIATYTWPTSQTGTSAYTIFNVSGLAGRGITGYRVMTPRVNEYVRIDTYFTVRLKAESEKVQALLENGELLTEVEMLNIAAFPMEIEEPDGSWSMFTNIYRQYDGMVQPGVPSHTDNEAVRVGLYGHDADRLDYGDEVELIYDHALAQASPITSSVGSSKNTDSVVANSLTEIVKGTFTLNAYQSISNTVGIPLWLQHEIVIKEGYYYDLLPEGWNFDPTASVIVRRYNGGAASLVGNPVIIDDYKGTNRQMIIFHVIAEGDAVNYNSQGYSGFTITVGAEISYEDNALYPRGYNIAVFQGVEYDENGNPMSDEHGYVPQVWELMHTNTNAYYDDGAYGNSVYNVIRDDGNYVFHDVNEDGITNQNDVLYMNSFVNPNYAKSVQTGVDKLIKGKSGVWQLHDVTDLDTDYYYHLSYKTTGQGTSRNVIIYDVLENAANTAGHKDEHFWKGTFKDIDVSYARTQGIDAKVYYSTATNLNENNNFSSRDSAGNPLPASQIQMDIINRPDLWFPYDSTTAPKDRITAIAVDLRFRTDGSEMIFDGYDNSETYFEITMHSPAELPDDPEAILAYNRPCYQTILNSGGEDTARFNINDRVTIELHDLKTVTLKKLTRSDPKTDENGLAIMDEEGNFQYEELPLGSVYFQLYQLTCTNEKHTALTNHSNPPATTSVTGTSSNNCWTRIAVGQTRSDGTVSFENLESGTYALREYSPYYYSDYSNNHAYVVASRYRLENMWWSFEVDARSKNEPVLTYRGSTSYNSDSYKDFAFGTKDSEIINFAPDDPTRTRTVWNVRTRQSLTIKKQWWPVGSDEEFGIKSVKVNILRNGELYMKDIELTKADNWTTTIYNLPCTSAYGTLYHYTIEETEESLAALAEYGFKAVVDNNNYTGYSGSATAGYSQERRLHNSTLDHLIISKSVTEGGDQTKQYLFKLRMTNQENEVLTGSYDYTRYKLMEEDGAMKWVSQRNDSFRLDSDGTWGQLLLAHDERIVIEGLPVGTNYVITEIGADGYTQTTTKGSLSGKIEASGENERLDAPEENLTNEVAVTNTYQSEGRNSVTANKTINTRRPVYFKDNIFTYYLKPIAWHQEGAEEGAEDAITTYRLDGSTRRSIDFTANNGKGYPVNNNAEGTITFPTLIWQTGVSGYKGYRVYTVREEVDTERPGFELDKTVYVVWVDLQDDEAGTLKSTVTYYKTVLKEGQTEIDIEERGEWTKLNSLSDLKFNNIYSAEGELRLRLTKTINGLVPEAGAFAGKQFSYSLYKNENDRPGDVLATLKNNDQGVAEALLGTFDIDDVGSNQFFRYFLQEDALDRNGTTIDSILYSITVQITDNRQGRLGAQVDIVSIKDGKRTTIPTVTIALPLPVKEGEETPESYATELESMLNALGQKLKFDNKYEAGGTWQPGIEKWVNGTLIDTTYYANHTFTFTLSAVDASGKETRLGEAQNGADGKALFEEMAYTSSDINKTYTYVIHETGASGSGITVNDVPWTVTLRVDDAGEGVLNPTVLSVKKGDEEVWNAESGEPAPEMNFRFNNTYEAKGELTIDGTKALTGRVMKDKEFRFAIRDAEGSIVSNGTSDADGKITFEPIRYAQGNENKHYEYKVYEVNDGQAGITYDDLEWKLAVDVTDSGTGALKVTYKLSKTEPAAP